MGHTTIKGGTGEYSTKSCEQKGILELKISLVNYLGCTGLPHHKHTSHFIDILNRQQFIEAQLATSKASLVFSINTSL